VFGHAKIFRREGGLRTNGRFAPEAAGPSIRKCCGCDYAATDQMALSIVDADSFWVDGYDRPAAHRRRRSREIWLLGYGRVQGHVDSVARGIVVSNATPGQERARLGQPSLHMGAADATHSRAHPDGQAPPDVRLVVG
jgi:hypothetical protein